MKKRILIIKGFIIAWIVVTYAFFGSEMKNVQAGEQDSQEVLLQRAWEAEQQIMELEDDEYETMQNGNFDDLILMQSDRTIAEAIGMNGEIYIDWLKSHQNDGYYLGTVYRPYDWRSPKGDISFNGMEGMNCTGFVWHALMKATNESGGNAGAIPALSGWVSFYKTNGIQRQYFQNKQEMLSSGYLDKGDLIWIMDGDENSLSDYHHIGIYWGDGNSDNWWHSLNGWSLGMGLPYDGNMMSSICSASANPIYVVLKTGGIETPPSAEKFTDNSPGAWYYNYVTDVFHKNIMTGLNEYYFGAAESLARAQFATILYRMENQPEFSYTAPFPDVADRLFYSIPVSWAKEKEVIGGYENGMFGPADFITREQMVTMMHRYAGLKGTDVSNRASLERFPDGAYVSKFAREAMNWAVAEKIIQGNGEGYLMPQGYVNRAECATIISRYYTE